MKYKVKGKLGTGGRFKRLTNSLAKKGAKNPKALAAFIGRKKYGPKKMASLAKKGKKGKKKERLMLHQKVARGMKV